MKASNHDHLGVENLKVELVPEWTEVEPPNLDAWSAPHDTIDGRISPQMNFGTTDREQEIQRCMWRSLREPIKSLVDVRSCVARVYDRKGHSLTLWRSAIS